MNEKYENVLENVLGLFWGKAAWKCFSNGKSCRKMSFSISLSQKGLRDLPTVFRHYGRIDFVASEDRIVPLE
jgi:hypothetical protein